MKKLLTSLLLIVSIFALTGCNGNENPEEIFKEAMDNMAETDNLRMYVAIYEDATLIYETTYKVDGDVYSLEVFGNTYYVEEIDEETINVIAPLSTEKPTIAYFGEEAPSNTFDAFTEERYLFEDFTYENFSYAEGIFTQIETEENVTELTLEIGNGYIKEINMTLVVDGVTYTSVVLYKNYGVTTVEVPNYITEQTFIDKAAEVNENTDYNLVIDRDGFELTTYDTTYMYILGTIEVRFDALNAKYFPGIDSVFINETTYDLDAYLQTEGHYDSLEVFELVKELFNLYFE